MILNYPFQYIFLYLQALSAAYPLENLTIEMFSSAAFQMHLVALLTDFSFGKVVLVHGFQNRSVGVLKLFLMSCIFPCNSIFEYLFS